jgi:hypothetical protein
MVFAALASGVDGDLQVFLEATLAGEVGEAAGAQPGFELLFFKTSDGGDELDPHSADIDRANSRAFLEKRFESVANTGGVGLFHTACSGGGAGAAEISNSAGRKHVPIDARKGGRDGRGRV